MTLENMLQTMSMPWHFAASSKRTKRIESEADEEAGSSQLVPPQQDAVLGLDDEQVEASADWQDVDWQVAER